MTTVQHFTELRVWQEARVVVKDVYALTGDGSLARDFTLRDQLRSAALSVMSNIAEGFTRRTHQDFARFLDISRASSAEVQSLFFVCEDTGFVMPDEAALLRRGYEGVSRMIAGMQSYLRPGTREPETEYQP